MKPILSYPLRVHPRLAAALVVALGLSSCASGGSSSAQITPGNSGSISPGGGVTTVASGESKQKLDSALSPATRQTLQEAMDSTPAEPAPQ